MDRKLTSTQTDSQAHIILFLLLPGLFIADVIHGALLHNGIELGISISAVIRSLIFAAATIYIVVYASNIPRPYLLTAGILFALTIPGVLNSLLNLHEPYYRIYEIKELAKVLFGPVLVLLFIALITRGYVHRRSLALWVEITGYGIGACLLTMQIAGIGFSEDHSIWSKGYFSAQNDISHALVLTYIVALYKNMISPRLSRLTGLLVLVSALFLLGQRVSLASLVLMPILVFVMLIFSRSNKWSGIVKLRRLSVTAIVFVILGTLGAGYLIMNPSILHKPIEKIQANLEGQGERVEVYKSGKRQLEKRATTYKVLGEGAASYQSWVYKRHGLEPDGGFRLVEMDWVDLYGAYGLAFVLALYSLLFLLIIKVARDFVRSRDPTTGSVLVMLIVFSLHSLVVGHAMTSPMPSSIMAAALAVYLSALSVQPDR